ncbi:MAG: hypothetical protein F4X25_02570 [Chloroflexi bacterium]|nr:hypothetical protein [Chloroflexota bacterium]
MAGWGGGGGAWRPPPPHPSAYRYLPDSVDHFPAAAELSERIEDAGFEGASIRRFGLGTVALHVATRRGES